MIALIESKLREAVIDISKFDERHLTGFCRYNPQISSYALENKDQMAETLIFVIATQQTDWPTVVGSFKHIIFKLQKDGTLYDNPEKRQYNQGTPYYGLIGMMGTKKIEPINFIWKNRSAIYSQIKNILSKFEYKKTTKNNELAVLNLFKLCLTLPQLSLAKAGFAVQMMTGRLGCFDSLNAQIYPVPDEYTKELFGPDGKFKPVPSGKESYERRLKSYINMLNVLSNSADSPLNQSLWDAWTHVIAERINLIGEPENVTVKQGKKKVELGPYRPPIKSGKYPDIEKYVEKYKGSITGDDVSKQHYMPNLIHGESVGNKILGKLNEYVNINGVIYESALLIEAELDPHSTDRMRERLEVMGINDITPIEKEIIFRNLEAVKEKKFEKRYSFGVFLGRITPNKASKYYVEQGGKGYYQIPSPSELKVGEPYSIGNEVWAIIRNDIITTIFLRMDWQTKDLKQNSAAMKVDASIRNVNNFDINRMNTKI